MAYCDCDVKQGPQLRIYFFVGRGGWLVKSKEKAFNTKCIFLSDSCNMALSLFVEKRAKKEKYISHLCCVLSPAEPSHNPGPEQPQELELTWL